MGTDNRERGRLSGPLVDLLIRVTDSPSHGTEGKGGEEKSGPLKTTFYNERVGVREKGRGGKVCRH